MNVVGSFGLPRYRLLVLPAIGVAALLGILATGFFMQRASSEPAPVTLTACVSYYTGGMRMLNRAGATCSSSEYPVTWNQQGPEGPPGPQGPEGPEGPPGGTANLVPLEPMTVVCPNGDAVVSGGYEFIYDQDGFVPPQVVLDRPYYPLPGQEGWMITVFHDGSSLIADVFAMCSPAANPDALYLATERHQVGSDEGGEEGGGGDDGR
ncbi:MAG: hypothetical protein R3A46_17680 [Thermomicrobiales bacterium]